MAKPAQCSSTSSLVRHESLGHHCWMHILKSTHSDEAAALLLTVYLLWSGREENVCGVAYFHFKDALSVMNENCKIFTLLFNILSFSCRYLKTHDEVQDKPRHALNCTVESVRLRSALQHHRGASRPIRNLSKPSSAVHSAGKLTQYRFRY
jgi:hypothetical protein